MPPKRSSTKNVGLGEFLRRQRELGQLSVRQLADACGISNAYLSQIERGLRSPSSFVLKALADGLELSSETLYAQAGILDPSEVEIEDVIEAIRHGVAADGAGEKTPVEAEIADRPWRADPTDGLRPMRPVRSTWIP